jgi:rRNA maturation RNase YbeY
MPYEIEINQRSGKRIEKKWIEKIIKSVLKMLDIKNVELSVAIVGDQEMKNLNKKWRGKNRVTDVLSFDYRSKLTQIKTQENAELNGEIIICYPQARRQAKDANHSVKEEIKTLLVHGLLHLCGYDHEKSLRGAEKMRKMEKIFLEKIKNKN